MVPCCSLASLETPLLLTQRMLLKSYLLIYAALYLSPWYLFLASHFLCLCLYQVTVKTAGLRVAAEEKLLSSDSLLLISYITLGM